jgi:membrane protein DedA with SNARE-associated domain
MNTDTLNTAIYYLYYTLITLIAAGLAFYKVIPGDTVILLLGGVAGHGFAVATLAKSATTVTTTTGDSTQTVQTNGALSAKQAPSVTPDKG